MGEKGDGVRGRELGFFWDGGERWARVWKRDGEWGVERIERGN